VTLIVVIFISSILHRITAIITTDYLLTKHHLVNIYFKQQKIYYINSTSHV